MSLRHALKCIKSSPVPLWELEFQLWDAFSGEHLILGREFEALPAGEREKAVKSNAEIIASVSSMLGFSAVTVPGNYWESSPGVLAYYVLPPDGSMVKQLKAIKEIIPEDILLVANSGGVISMPSSEDYMNFSYKLFDSPEEIDSLAQKTCADAIEKIKILRDNGADIMLTASDLADNHGVFFNPEQMERFIIPYLDRWSRETHAAGAFSIMHSDGNLNPVLEMLADTALDGLQAIDPVAKMDIAEAKRIVGERLCLCGNIDCGLLLNGTPEQVRAATLKLLGECADSDGFVLGMSNASQPETKKENYLALVSARKEFYAEKR